MNLNKNFLTEVIKYLISKGVTLTDVLDTFNEHFNTLDTNDIKREHEKRNEVRKPITDIDLLLCGRSVEENSTPGEKVDEKPVKSSWIDYPKNIENHGNGVSPARKALFDVINGKTVIEHLKENGITYTNFDNRIRKKWSVEQACTTPLASWGKGKRKRVIEKPAETLETESNTEKPTESVTNATELNGNNITAVILDTPNPDAIRKDNIEKALKKFITSTTGIEYEESKKDKKPKETKSDLTVLEVCQKMNVTTHELREMINTGDFPQPDRGNKWSAKLLKDKGII